MVHDDGRDTDCGNDGDETGDVPSVFDILVGDVIGDDVFRAVADTRRRFALYYLLEHRQATVEELTDVVTGWSYAARGKAAGPTDRDAVATGLTHAHLPLLREAGLVTYEPDGDPDDVVTLAPLSDPVRTLLRWAYEREGGGHEQREGPGGNVE